jgi:hypothetical protein
LERQAAIERLHNYITENKILPSPVNLEKLESPKLKTLASKLEDKIEGSGK